MAEKFVHWAWVTMWVWLPDVDVGGNGGHVGIRCGFIMKSIAHELFPKRMISLTSSLTPRSFHLLTCMNIRWFEGITVAPHF